MFNNRNSFINSIPFVVKNLILINILLWFATIILPKAAGIDLQSILGLHYFGSQGFKPVQIISYMFMHGGFEHLFFNMFALFMFGSVLEQVWGQKRFLIYYMITGIGAGLVQMLVFYFQIQNIQAGLSPEMLQMVHTEGADVLARGMNYSDVVMGKLNLLLNTTTVGASGSVFGLLLAFAMMFPNMPLFLFFIPIPIKAKYMVIGYGLIEFFFGVANRSGDNVAHFAHLGGMLFGFLLILWWKNRKTNFYN